MLIPVLALPVIPLRFSYYLPALGIYWNSWRTLLLILSLPALSTIFFLFFMYESPKFLFAKGNEERALDILRKIHRFGKPRSIEELGVRYLSLTSLYWEETIVYCKEGSGIVKNKLIIVVVFGWCFTKLKFL